MKKPMAHITDHALIRYLERVLEMDVAALRLEVGRKVDLALDHPGASGIVVDGFSYKMSGTTVVTVRAACCPKQGQRGHRGAVAR